MRALVILVTIVMMNATTLAIDKVGPLEAPVVCSLSEHKVEVTVTAYSSERRQTDRTPHVTASGRLVRRGIIAVSRDLYRRFPFGTVVGLGGKEYVVDDLMHHKWTRRVDVWMPSKKEALNFGVRKATLYRVKRILCRRWKE